MPNFNTMPYNFFKIYNQHALLILAMIIGFVFRIYFLSSMNFYFDEAVYATFAKNFVENDISPWDGSAVQPPLFTWINSIPVYIFGTNEFSVRLPSVIFGTLSIALVYILANLWYGKKCAILSAFLIAVLPLHVIYSRLAFNDVVQTFFTLAAIIVVEYALRHNKKEKYRLALVIVSGLVFAMSYMVKYNSIVIWGIYWIFNLGYRITKRDKLLFKEYLAYFLLSSIIAAIVIVGIIFITGGTPHVIYLINSTLFWISFQYTQIFNPFYYYFLILFDGLSPIVYVLLPVSILYLFVYKRKKRNDYLILFLVLSYLLIVSLQTRRASRYLILVLPFMMILVSRFISIMFENSKYLKKTKLGIGLISFILISSFFWSIYEINKDINFNVWKETNKFIKENYQSTVKIHGSFHKSRLVQYYLQENPDTSEFIGTLKKGDLVVFTWLSNDTTILEHAPFEDKSTFLSKKRTEYDKDFIDYVLRHGNLIKTFEYKEKTALWLYEIKSLGLHREDKVKEEYLVKISLFGIWNFVCNQWSQDSLLKKVMHKLLSKDQIEAVNIKCVTKSYLK